MKNALHSVSYAGLWRGQAALSLEEFLHKAALLGFDGVELTAKHPHASTLSMNEGRATEVRRQLKTLSLECAAMAAYTDFCAGLEGGMIPLMEMQLCYLEQVIHLADQWDCRLVRVFTGYERPGVSFWEQWQACVAGIREACRLAKPYGVTIGIQNHHDIAMDAATLRSFIEEIGYENCKIMLDPWAPCAQGRDAANEIDLVFDQMVYTTLADYQKVPRYHYHPAIVNYSQELPLLRACGMGDGFIENRAFLHKLMQKGYNGWVCYEMCSDLMGGGGMENLDQKAAQFLRFMRETLAAKA